MGIYIFLTLVVVEMALAVYCTITKSNMRKVRSIIRIGEFTGFLLITVLSIIEWSFRYYALAAVLFLSSPYQQSYFPSMKLVPVLNVYSDGGWKILASRPQYAQNYELLSDADAAAKIIK